MKVVCLIDTRNHSRFIDECVQSCLTQEVPATCNYEVHAVDAGSTDGTLAKLEAYGPRLTLHPRDNIGQSGAFNLCMALDADVFMFCDGDDRLHKSRLQSIVDVFATRHDVAMVGHSIREVDIDGNLIRKVFVDRDHCFDVREPGDADRLYGARCLLGTSRLAVRRPELLKILPIGRTILFEADEYIFNLLPNFGRVCILGAALTDYRLHGENNYQNSKPSLERTQRFHQVHVELLTGMIEMRDRHKLAGRYIELCEEGLRAVCQRTKSFESALKDRRSAVRLLVTSPGVFGLVNASLVKRSLYSLMVLMLGLQLSLELYYLIKSHLDLPRPTPDSQLSMTNDVVG